MLRAVSRSFRLSNGFVVSSCRFGETVVGPRADDVTKFTAGLLHQTHRRESCRHQHEQSAQPGHQHHAHRHLPRHSILMDLNCVPLCHPLCPPQLLCAALQVAHFSTSRDCRKREVPPTTHTHIRSGSASTEKVETANGVTKATEKSKEGVAKAATSGDGGVSSEEGAAKEGEEKLSIFKRFKRAYKEHGKVLVAVHVATSIVWYGSFYTIARGGVDIVPYLEQWNFSETMIKPFRAGGLGDFAVAYLMYKLATPARYTVTLAGTNMVIRYLRSRGHMAPKSQEDSLRQLYKEGRHRFKNSKLRQDRLKKLREAREKRKSTGLGKRK